jgi:hypothetical protein
MKKIVLAIVLLLSVNIFAADGASLASQLGLDAGTKVTKQWKRIFKSARKMKKRGIDKLSSADQATLKEYLINNAGDSDSAESAGR